MEAGGIVAAIALFAGVGLAAFDHVVALTIGTSHRNEDHHLTLSEERVSMADISVKVQICNTTRMRVRVCMDVAFKHPALNPTSPECGLEERRALRYQFGLS